MSHASFSSSQRQKKDSTLLEMETFIKQTFESTVLLNSYPRSEIDIYIQILQFDGGVLHTSINATTLALLEAGIQMFDFVCACSAAPEQNEKNVLLDLNYTEESLDVPLLTLALLPQRETKFNLISVRIVFFTKCIFLINIYRFKDVCILIS
jgi:exosome complex component RRP41